MSQIQELTSAQAAKLLRKWNEELTALKDREEISREFVASVGEDLEQVRPDYDYAAVQEAIGALEGKIRALKHALNLFNANTEVPGFGMTVDQMLVYIPQLSQRKIKYSDMMSKLPKARETGAAYTRGNIIDYRYANYDISAAEKDYSEAADTLGRAQTALDVVNNTLTMEIDL